MSTLMDQDRRTSAGPAETPSLSEDLQHLFLDQTQMKSFRENPTVIREARALGIPVVAAPCGDLAEWARSDADLWLTGTSG